MKKIDELVALHDILWGHLKRYQCFYNLGMINAVLLALSILDEKEYRLYTDTDIYRGFVGVESSLISMEQEDNTINGESNGMDQTNEV